MREIKFRIWDGRKMIYDCGLLIKGNNILIQDKGNKNLSIPMQFTGLKDKNGKEIFEGDICLIVGDDIPYEVIFNQTLSQFQFGSFNIRKLSPLNEFERDDLKLINVEVIGNIYENPELLRYL